MRMEIPSWLIKPQAPSLENVELRATLEKAVEDAKLNADERNALNQEFFPNGGGFNLPSDAKAPAGKTIIYREGKNINQDTFTKEHSEQDIESQSRLVPENERNSSKSDFQTNLENALKKLKEVLKDSI